MTVAPAPVARSGAAYVRPAPAGPGVGWLRRLVPFIRRYKRTVIATLVFSVLAQVLIGLLPLIQQQIVDDSILSDERPLGPMLVLLVATGVVGFSTNYLRRYLGAKVSVNLQHDLRLAIHRHLYELDFSRHDELSVGDIMSRSTADLTLLQIFFFSVPMLVANVTLLLVALVVMFVLSPLLSLIVVAFIPLFAYVAIRFRDRIFPASWNDQRLSGAIAGVVDENVTGVRVVKAFAQEDREFDRLVDRGPTSCSSPACERRASTPATRPPCRHSRCSPSSACSPSAAGWRSRATSRSACSWPSPATSCRSSRRCASCRACSARPSRRGPAPSGSSSCWTCEPRVADAPDARAVARPAGRDRRSSGVSFGYGDATRRRCATSASHIQSGRAGRPRRCVRFGQDDPRLPDGPLLRPDDRHGAARRHGRAGADAHLAATDCRGRLRGELPVLGEHPREHRLRATRMPPTRRSRPRLEWRRPTTSSSACRTGTARWSASAGSPCPAASASASRSPAPPWPTPRCSCSTTRRSAIDAHTEEAIHASLRDELASRTTILIAHRSSTLRLADRVLVLDGGRIVAEGTNAELWHSSALYRELLTGPELDRTEPLPDEAQQVDPAAWPRSGEDDDPIGPQLSLATMFAGMAGGGAAAPGVRAAGLVAATPELLEQVAALPPLRGDPDVDLVEATAQDHRSSMRRLAHRFRWPLVFVAIFVLIDAATTLIGPLIIRHGLDAGVEDGDKRILWSMCLAYLAVQLLSWGNAFGELMHTSRTAERMLYSLRGTHVQAPAAPVARLLRQGDGRADHDPHDHRRRGPGPAAAAGPAARADEHRQLRRRRRDPARAGRAARRSPRSRSCRFSLASRSGSNAAPGARTCAPAIRSRP